MPILPFQIITTTADLVIFIFIAYYLLKIRAKEKEIEKKENKIDTDYHKIVDNALSKERKIMDDATAGYQQIVDDTLAKERRILENATYEASQIISGAQYINQNSKEMIDQALQKMIVDIQKEAFDTSRTFMTHYQTSLQQLTTQSLNDFQNVTKGLEIDLQKQITNFHDNLLPNVEKELEQYKQTRFQEAEQTINRVIQKVSQEIFNMSISLNDHQKLIIESLEKAKKAGIFN